MDDYKEPWEVSRGTFGKLYDADGAHIASIGDERQADRICTCVNVCVGVANKDLAKLGDALGTLNEYIEVQRQNDALRAQRDKLREACIGVLGNFRESYQELVHGADRPALDEAMAALNQALAETEDS